MLEALSAYIAEGEEEFHKEEILSLIANHPDCYYRTHFNPGHITGSGLLLSADRTRVLMNHHKILDLWVCFGGHADGDTNILNVALRETMEESGIENIEPVTPAIFDIDVHPIPPNTKKNEPSHKHFDIRYLFRVRDRCSEDFVISDESKSLRWCDFETAMVLAPDDYSMQRLLRKWWHPV